MLSQSPRAPSTKDNVSSYRPISLLHLSSKVLEHHLHNILLEQLSSKDDEQFGFRKGRSTVIPLLMATHQWHRALDNSHEVAYMYMCVLDYTKTSRSGTGATFHLSGNDWKLCIRQAWLFTPEYAIRSW